MIEDENKIDCIDSLVFGLNRTAEWGKKMAIRYPSDPRNARAAECLSRLAIEAAGLSDDAWLKMQPHVRRLGKTSDGGKRSVKRRGALDFNLELKICNRSSIT